MGRAALSFIPRDMVTVIPPLFLQVVLSDCGLSQGLAPGITSVWIYKLPTYVCIMSGCTLLKFFPSCQISHCHFQEKQQLDYEELIQVLKKEQDIYAHLVKSLQDPDR